MLEAGLAQPRGEIDQAGRHDEAGGVDDAIRAKARRRIADGRDPAVGDVEAGVPTNANGSLAVGPAMKRDFPEIVEFDVNPLTVFDDGTGPARVVLRPATGLRLPRVALGTWAAAAGIAGQYARSAPWTDGHRLMPRGAGDLDPTGRRAPARLPSTGLGGSPGLTVRLGFYTMPGR